jgi:hypothetical protein
MSGSSDLAIVSTPVDLAWRQHQRLGAVVLDATAQVLDFEPIARQDAELCVARRR